MARLIFETDNGEQNEIKMSTIKSKSLNSDDIILVDCEVGTATNDAVQQYMVGVRDMIQAYLPNNKIIVTAVRQGKKDINLKIVKEKKE